MLTSARLEFLASFVHLWTLPLYLLDEAPGTCRVGWDLAKLQNVMG